MRCKNLIVYPLVGLGFFFIALHFSCCFYFGENQFFGGAKVASELPPHVRKERQKKKKKKTGASLP